MSDTFNNYKITDLDLNGKKISQLSDRPNAPSHYGGAGMSAEGLKKAFDGQIEVVRDKFNALCVELNNREGPKSAEVARRLAESQRESAEELRVSAETNRFNEFGQLMNRFETVLHQAKSKTDAINADEVVLAVLAKLPVGDEVSY